MKRGVVKCDKRLLEEMLFQGLAKIERVAETDEDLMCGLVSLVVSGHYSLPEVSEGQITPLVEAVFEKTAFHFRSRDRANDGN